MIAGDLARVRAGWLRYDNPGRDSIGFVRLVSRGVVRAVFNPARIALFRARRSESSLRERLMYSSDRRVEVLGALGRLLVETSEQSAFTATH